MTRSIRTRSRPSDVSPAVSPSPRSTLVAALLGFFIITLDAVIVNVALPEIRSDLGGGIRGLQWVVDGYTLMFAAGLLSAGSLVDRIGAKRSFAAGLLGFLIASAACGLAPSLGALVAFRFVQGTAAAVMMPASMALIGQAYPEPGRRSRAVAAWAMGGAVASSSAPVLGGLLTLVDWRLIFLVNLPVSAAALGLLARAARSPHHEVPFDWIGQLTAVSAMGAVVYGVIEAGDHGFPNVRVVTALVVAVVATVGFVLTQARTRHPMLPLDLVRSRTVLAVVAIGFAFMVGYYGLPFVMSLYLQQVRGLSSLDTGVAFLPMMLVGLVLTPLGPRVVDRLGARVVVAGGLTLMAAGLVTLAVVPPSTPLVVLSALMVLVGIGGPTIAPPITSVLLGAVPTKRTGTASGLLNTSRQLGGALAVAVFGGLLAAPSGFATGMRVSFLLATAVTLAAAFTALIGLPTRASA